MESAQIANSFSDSLDVEPTSLSVEADFHQGFFQLASARHSMGATRINSVMLSLKPHNAATRLQVT